MSTRWCSFNSRTGSEGLRPIAGQGLCAVKGRAVGAATATVQMIRGSANRSRRGWRADLLLGEADNRAGRRLTVSGGSAYKKIYSPDGLERAQLAILALALEPLDRIIKSPVQCIYR